MVLFQLEILPTDRPNYNYNALKFSAKRNVPSRGIKFPKATYIPSKMRETHVF
jgi:hypothetical protein